MYGNNQLMPDDESDEAWAEWGKIEKEWEDALEKYEARLKEIDDKLPDSREEVHGEVPSSRRNCSRRKLEFQHRFHRTSHATIGHSPERLGAGIFCILRYKIAHPGHVTTLLGGMFPASNRKCIRVRGSDQQSKLLVV
jgi:hypothetical protein